MLVRFWLITEPFARYGPAEELGIRSTYCSPTADRSATAACRSAGIFAVPESMCMSTSMPEWVRRIAATLPTVTPR